MKLAWDPKNKIDYSDGKYHRPRSDDLYHTTQWTKLSQAYRTAHPLCAECQRHGRIVAATCVDHIVPFPICRDYFFDETNLQSLCDECNHLKGQRDKEKIEDWKKKQQ